MKVLIACEESQAVLEAFLAKGHDAYSNDIIDCSGNYPERHLKCDVREILNDGWDLMIAHPPCTFLTVAGNKWFNPEYSDRFPTRGKDRKEAVDFFMVLANAPIHKIAIENPIGVMSTIWQKPQQIIQPYQYGHTERKATCLWLKNLPLLQPTNIVEPQIVKLSSGKTMSKLHYDSVSLPKEERAKLRSKTFEGIAKAMAEQWG